MSRRRSLPNAAILGSTLLLSVSCQGHPALSGSLIYGDTYKLHTYNLADSSGELLYEVVEGAQQLYDIQALAKLDTERFLLAINKIAEESDIIEFNRNTGEKRFVRHGWGPTYIPEHRKLFFFHGTRETGPRLFLVDIDEPVESARPIAEEKGKFGSYVQVIQVSRDEVVFLIRDDRRSPPYLYNLVTDTLEPLPFTHWCRPSAWRNKTRQLLCGDDYGEFGFYLIDLTGENIEQIPLAESTVPTLYIPEFDVLISSVARLNLFPPSQIGEVRDMWAYSFEHKESWRITKNAWLGQGSAVWFSGVEK